MHSEFLSNEEIVQKAKKNLVQGAWDYLAGGSESETTMRRNRLAFDKIAFRPRVLINVSEIDTQTTILNEKLRIPILLAPIGSLQTFTQKGGAAASKSASDFGIVHVVSSVTEPSLEEIAAVSNSPKIYQLYIHGDWGWTKEMIQRAKSAGYKALCITVDTASYSRRERPMLNDYIPFSQQTSEASKSEVNQFGQIDGDLKAFSMASVTWDTIDKIKKEWGKPLLLKGIATKEDAKIALEHEIECIWVSNHGGRQLDHGQGTMEMLPEIVDTVAGEAEIIVDGGVLRGSDIVKAIGMGANAVAIGKMQGWGLAAGGSKALTRSLEILEEEMVIAMGLLGTPSIKDITPNHLCSSDPVVHAHEMSAWTNMPGGRIF